MRLSFVCVMLLIAAAQVSCNKSNFLNTKPDQALNIPTSIADCQALLDNDLTMNGYGNSGYPGLKFAGCDDFYVSKAQFLQYPASDQNAVTWAKDIYANEEVNDWNLPYKVALYANVALEALSRLHPSTDEQADWNNAKGGALFFRSYAFYELAQVFAPAYDSITAAQDWGIPLRITADVSEKSHRSTVKETYELIIADLDTAISILPERNASPTRPSRAAAYGLLSRIYLSARNYTAAGLYADSCLQIRHELMDYNTIDPGNIFPFTRTNPEVIFGAAYFTSGPSANARSYTDSVLFASYTSNDLRRQLFFKNGRYFFGKYDEDGYAFCGIATDEMILTRAECYARAGNVTAAISDLNTLLVTRWAAGTYVSLISTDANTALQLILTERRK